VPPGGGQAIHRVGAHAVRGDFRIGHARRCATGHHRLDRLDQRAAVGHDHLVCCAQVLAGAVLNGAHALAGPLVVHVDVALAHAQVGAALLLIGAEAPVVMAAGLRDVVGQGDGLQPLVAHDLLVHWRIEAGEDGIPVVVGVVHRHVDLGDRHRLGQRNHEGAGEDRVGHPGMRDLVVDGSQRGQLQTVGHGGERNVGLVELTHHLGHRQALAVEFAQAGAAELAAVAFFQRLVVEEAVQKRRMRRVDAHLKRLQPVAVPQALEGKAVRGRRGKAVERGEGRGRHVLRPKPAKQHASLFNKRVATLLDTLAQRAARGLAGRIKALAAGVELPAMERAAQAVALVAAKGKVGATVRAIAVQQAEAPSAFLNSTKSCPSRRTAFTGRAPMAGSSAGLNSSTSATGCQ
jgi:hypothetical protein